MNISDRKRAAKLLSIYHGSADDFFKLWPADKQFFFSSDRKAFLAYRRYKNVAVCLGDPVGHSSSIQLVLSEFKYYCNKQHLLVTCIQTDSRYQSEYTDIGLSSIFIGSDAIIAVDSFLKTTVHNKYFRNIVNRFTKQHFTTSVSMPPHNQKILGDIQLISDSWLQLPNRKNWSFLTGSMQKDYLQQVSLYILRDSTGKAQAFVNQIPSYKPGVATIDLMRHAVTAPPNCMDYLFISLMRQLQQEGYSEFNLGMSPLDGTLPHNDCKAWILRRGYLLANKFIGFHGLHQFKAKYEPTWEPRYVWYQGGILQLPTYARAIYNLMRSE